ncbi:MAG TPA: hypothetical protein DDY73_02600 [Coprobacter fastidiosus]|jgi:hypothetical protein|uniref:Porin n=1 Tax=Coprobacter fastidiosus TaxID=1099853 RepID=A0A316RE39_9BACT|nr:DcaP family trimeric outer membrane transporter [Coprobacter fastidiosus]MBS6410732.1 porin [Tannerella sp.]PWM11329.1 MAG: hypothetical protein DBY02_01235 [Coprobacter fastidiosus]CDD90601.1 putative uncharacterized protein [Tannerella sp. CAG:51]HBJ07871.1 hypothetical protein [Coprobacter fastidiosus]
MEKIFRICFIAVLLGLFMPVHAQKKKMSPLFNDDFIILTGKNGPSCKDIVNIFRETRSLHFQDPDAPRFLLVDQKHQMALGIGGYVRLTTSYDFRGISDNVDFVPYDIPTPANPAEKSQYQMDASTSRIFLKLVGNNKALGKFSAYIETDFRGDHHTLRLRQAYVSMRGFLLGQSWSTFSDLASIPPTIDFEGPNANTTLRNVQVRYTYNINKHWQIAIAAENPNPDITYGTYSRSIKQRMPDIPAYIQYNWGASSHIRATGLFRGLSYRNMVTENNRTLVGWGAQLSGLATLFPGFTFYYQGTYGKGISQYIDDLDSNNSDLVPDPCSEGRLQALPVLAFLGGVKYAFTSKCFASASYSQVRLYSRHGYYDAEGYKYGQYAVGNVFWNVTPNCQLGVEYLYGRRMSMDKSSGHASRIQAMVQYNF